MTDSQNRQATMQSRRIDLERAITIRVPAFDSFVTEYSSNVSTTGMFIQSDKPLPPDTKLSFEFKVADDWKLIRGKANVIWSRYHGEGPDRPAGMGVLFTELDPQSRRLIQWIIEKHVRDGGTPFDLGELKQTYEEEQSATSQPTEPPEMPPPVTRVMTQPELKPERSSRSPKPSRPSPRTRDKPLPFRLGLLLVAGIVVASVLGALFWLSERSAQSAANPDLPPASETAAAGQGQSEETTVGSTEAPNTGDDPAPARETPEPATATSPPALPMFAQAAERLVARWSSDWSSQDPDRYLSHYARDFVPSNGQSRPEWEARRRERLSAPEFIQVSVGDLETELVSESRGRISFTQTYRSDTFEDEVRKSLALVREDGGWKILEETAVN